jgi:hypothetical protein
MAMTGNKVADLNRIIGEKHPPHPDINLEKLKEGDNIVYQDNDKKLVARVNSGVIYEWVAFDGSGAEIPSVVIRNAANAVSASATRQPRYYIVCACFPGFPSDNTCWWVAVP